MVKSTLRKCRRCRREVKHLEVRWFNCPNEETHCVCPDCYDILTQLRAHPDLLPGWAVEVQDPLPF